MVLTVLIWDLLVLTFDLTQDLLVLMGFDWGLTGLDTDSGLVSLDVGLDSGLVGLDEF